MELSSYREEGREGEREGREEGSIKGLCISTYLVT